MKSMGFKDQFGLKLGRTGWEKERKESRKRKKRRGRRRAKPKVWKLNLCKDSMRLSMNFHALMLKCLSPNLGF